ncbi:MAG: cytochrome P450 [Deltaproteobacteria bacterium]|nr:cytochrome P450 [Deltaproteobacteria bacterium]
MADMQETFGGDFMSPVVDPYSTYARLRVEEPVKALQLFSGPGYVVTRHADVRAVATNPTLYSSHSNANGIGLVMGRTILEMDGAEHGKHRGLIAPAFVPRALRTDLPELLDTICHEQIDSFAGAGGADLVAQFTATIPIRVIAHVIGIPMHDYPIFHAWGLDIIGFTDDPPRGFAAAQQLVEFLRPLLAARRAEPREDLISRLAHAEIDGERLTDEEIFCFLRLLLPAGAETTFRLIGNTLFALLTHPEALAAVRADRAQLDWAIEESLRWESPVQYASRETTAATTLGGTPLPEGAQILLALGSANRDESVFPDAARFQLARRPEDHFAFGFGRHFCAGSHLARLEARSAISALLDRFPALRVAPGAAPQVVGLAFRSPPALPVVF